MGLLPFERFERKILVRKPADTSLRFGKKPEDRTVEELLEYGVVNIDKPSGPTSHQVSAYVKDILNIDKAGHSGTLDPAVTGVLPVTLGKSTKVVQTLLKAGKEYVCLMHVHKLVEEFNIYKVMDKFTGEINQLPPVKSAVKRQWRKRKIYYNEIIEISGQDVLFKTGCQAGTYIRKLCTDIGKELGTGAHMQELRRTKVGPFNEDSLVTLHDLKDAFYYYKQGKDKFLKSLIQPIENAVKHLPKVWVFDTTVDALCNGASLALPGISKVESDIQKEDFVTIMTLKGELIAYGRAVLTSKEMLGENGIAVLTEKVLMKPGTYPKRMVKI